MKHYWIILMAVVGMGCADAADRAQRDNADCAADCQKWQINDPDTDTSDDGDEDASAPNTQPLGPCAPQPDIEHDFVVPEIPEQVRSGECPLEREVENWVSSSLPSEYAIAWAYQDGDLVQTDRADGDVQMRTIFEFGDDDEQIERIDRSQFHLTGRGVRLIHEDIWEFDGQGRVLRHHYKYRSGQPGQESVRGETEITQRFADGHLVEHVETKTSDQNMQQTQYSWSYNEAGRLTEALKVGDDRSDRAVWEYDGELPRSVSRYVDDVLAERLTWDFNNEGRLVSRRIETGLELNEADAGEPVVLHQPVVLDSYALRSTAASWGRFTGVSTPWSGANSHLNASEDAGCYQLPSTLGHGYPEGDNSYYIGALPTVTPEPEMEYAYGFQLYYYGFSRPVWYGHTGIGSMWPAFNYQYDRRVESTVTYNDAGRMTSESMEQFFSDPELESVSITRERQFEGSYLIDDEIAVQRGEQTVRAGLHFERNSDGALLRRERTRDDELVAFQEWNHGEGSESVTLNIHVAKRENPVEDAYDYYALLEPAELLETPGGETPEQTATTRREFDAMGREVFYREDRLFEGRRTERHITWGDHGMLEKSEAQYQGAERRNNALTYWDYDASGELANMRVDSDGDGTLENETRYTRDEAGRMVERVDLHQGAVYQRVSREFACQ